MMTMRSTTRMMLSAALALMLSGCLQIELYIKLNPDASGIITERVRFSRELINLSLSSTQPDLKILGLLEKDALLNRMKFMGPKVELVSHEVRDAEGASRESVAVFRVADLSHFTYVSPFPAGGLTTLSMGLGSTLKSPRTGIGTGWVLVWFGPGKDPRPAPPPRDPKLPPLPGPTPADVQMVRELRPVFADLLNQFRVKVTFETYAPVLTSTFGWRGSNSGTRVVDVLDFNPSRNCDAHAMPFLDNEEIMLDLLRWRLGSPTIQRHLANWTENGTLPVIHAQGGVYFAPSQTFYDRFFEGKTLEFDRGNNPPEIVKASFARIGWKGPSATSRPDSKTSSTSRPN